MWKAINSRVNKARGSSETGHRGKGAAVENPSHDKNKEANTAAAAERREKKGGDKTTLLVTMTYVII